MALSESPTKKRKLAGVEDSCAAVKTSEYEVQKKKEQPRGHRRVHVLILLVIASLLMLSPTAYCSFGEKQLDLADSYRQRAHGSQDSQCGDSCQAMDHDSSIHGALNTDDRKIRQNILSGAINSLVVMSASVLSGIALDLPGNAILGISTSNLLASAFASGFSRYMLESSRDEFASRQLQLEYEEVRNIPKDEINEMVCHYHQRGLSMEDARSVAATLSKYEDYWVRHMMVEELGVELPRGQDSIRISGLVAIASFLAFGSVPLLGVGVPPLLHRYFRCDEGCRTEQFSTLAVLVISAAALALLGVSLSNVTGCQCTIKNGLYLLIGGTLASVCALVGTKHISDFYLINASTIHTAKPRKDSCSSNVTRETPRPVNSETSRWTHDSRSSQTFLSDPDINAWKYFRDRFWWGLSLLWIGVSLIVSIAWVTEHMQEMGIECLKVFAYGWLTCITTGLGVVPFVFTGIDNITDHALAIANTAASGMMLSASAGMVFEAHDHCGFGDWQIILGFLAGGVFIRLSQYVLGHEDEAGVEGLHSALIERRHWRKAILIFTVMFCHSAAEGIAVGVAFDKQVHAQFGFYISLLLAIHNMPEGLAVALVLVPRGVSLRLASVIATLTSIPQPFLALTSFLFVDAFQFLLPIGLSFAAGAMVYVSLHELLLEAAAQIGRWRTFYITVSSFAMMLVVQCALQRLTQINE